MSVDLGINVMKTTFKAKSSGMLPGREIWEGALPCDVVSSPCVSGEQRSAGVLPGCGTQARALLCVTCCVNSMSDSGASIGWSAAWRENTGNSAVR